MIKPTNLILSFILLVSIALRIINLDAVPHGFHNDEASFLINAISISQTGRDEDGRLLPLYLHSYIDPKPALYSYLQIPFLSIFENQIFAARLPGALFGILSIFVMYLFCKSIKLPENLALLAAALLTISPWHINLSRSTQEVIVSFFFVLLTLYLLNKTLVERATNGRKKILLLLAALASAGVAMYSYHSAKIIIPAFASLLVFFSHKAKPSLVSSFLTGTALLVLGIVVHFSSPSANARFNAVGIFSDIGPQLILEEQVREATGELPIVVLRMFYNKPVSYGIHITNTYLSHFSPEFLFYELGQPKRYKIPEHGLLYYFDIPLLLIGIYLAIRRYQKIATLLLIAAFVAPIPSALTTQEIPSMIRSFFLVVPLVIFVSFGIYEIRKNIPHRAWIALLLVIGIGYAWSLAYFLIQFSVQQKHIQPWNRNVAEQKMAFAIKNVEYKYDHIVINRHSSQPYVYIVLEKLIPIQLLQSSQMKRLESDFELGKYKFVDSSCYLELKHNTLFVIHQNCEIPIDQGYSTIELATHEDGNDGFALVSWGDPSEYQDDIEGSDEKQ